MPRSFDGFRVFVIQNLCNALVRQVNTAWIRAPSRDSWAKTIRAPEQREHGLSCCYQMFYM